MQPSAVGI
jgi:hypothetical protein